MSLFNTNIFTRRRSIAADKTQPPSTETIEHYKRWWREAANGDSRFRVEEDDIFRGFQFQEPYFHVRLVEGNSEEGQTFSELVRLLYHRGVGAILCRDGWSVEQTSNVDCLFVSFGAVVDYLINGEIVERHQATLGWGPPDDIRTMSVSEPGFEILRPHHRQIIHQAMQTYKVEKPKVCLITDQRGAKTLVFNLNEYLPDPQAVSRVSALINYLLPGYYCQGIFNNDWDVAVYPVLPLSAGVEEALPEAAGPRDLLDEMYRSMRRMEVAYDADAVPSQGEQRWRNTAASPGTRFYLNMEDMVAGTDEGIYFVLRLCDSGEEGSVSFRQAALAAADAQCGLLLCRDWPVSPDVSLRQAENAYLTLRLGDLVDFLMTGNLERRRLASGGWLRPAEYYAGRLTEPDVRLLPIQSRMAITAAMNECGVAQPHMLSLHTLDDGRRLLYFCGYESVGGDSSRMHNLSERIHWCLPRHYTLLLSDSEEYIPWSVFPNSTIPSTDVIDLNISPEEEDEAEEITQ